MKRKGGGGMRGISFSVLAADGRLSTAICRLDGRDGFVPSEDSFLPSAGSGETAGLYSIPLGIQNNYDERQNKNESETKTVSLSSSEEGTEISSSKK